MSGLKNELKYAGLGMVCSDIADWQEKTFPDPNAHGVAEHLLREATEARDELWGFEFRGCDSVPVALPVSESTVARVAEELADIVHMAVQLSTCLDIDLVSACRAKLKKNQARKWKKPDEYGVVEHEPAEHEPAEREE